MVTELSITEDWRKQASAQQGQDPSAQLNEDVEKNFFDMAYNQIQNKATPLMKPQYRVGFEIVYKNDENTRLVGVFVFRVKDQFFYAPVFFINGNIKGTDEMYRANVKRFVPLNNDWCSYLISLGTMDEGKGISVRERQLTRDQMNLLDVVEPPQMFQYRRKFASIKSANVTDVQLISPERWGRMAGSEADIKALEQHDAALVAILTKAASIPAMSGESILRKFITEFGGYNAIKKIANTAKHDREFARALLLGSHADNYMPQLAAESPAKQAAAKRSPKLVIHTSVLNNDQVKNASVQDMCRGYMFEDFRKEAEVNEYVYEDATQSLDGVAAPGVYDILMADGSTRRCVAGVLRDMVLSPGSPNCVATCPSTYGEFCGNDIGIVDLTGGAFRRVNNRDVKSQVFGDWISDIDKETKLKDMSSATAGKAYVIVDIKEKTMSDPFFVVSKETSPAGLMQLNVTDGYKPTPNKSPIFYNPDCKEKFAGDYIFGEGCKLLEIQERKPATSSDAVCCDSSKDYFSYERLEELGNSSTLNTFIFDNKFKRAAVQFVGNDEKDEFLVRSARTDGKWTEELSKAAATCRLMLDCAMRQSLAEDMLKQAKDTKKTRHFLYEGLEKKSYNMRFNDWPEFYDRMNNEFQVLEQPRSNWMLESEFDKPIVMPHRVGDVWSQDSSETLDTMTPLQLYDASKQKGVGNMFEHGVVGELVKTYDATAMVQTYISDMEVTLDRLGRIIFLFYWKPEDFSKSYGSDDQSALENKLLSNFKSLGELTLELIQKAKDQQEGTVSLT